MNRHLIFKHYWWLAILLGTIASLFAYRIGGDDRAGLIGASVAGAIGFCYFVQQQKLAETNLFYQLFTAFNARYDKLNGPLSDILLQKSDLTAEQRKDVVDYFNLCAEEYLFYTRGYMPPEVWRSWCRGMAWYLRRHPFKDVWDQEIKSESFYGLSLDVIHKGAA